MKPVPFDDLPDDLIPSVRAVPLDDLPDDLRPEQDDPGYFSNLGSLLVDGGRRALTAARVSPSVIAGDAPDEHSSLISEQLQRPPQADPPELQELKGAFEDDGEAWEQAEGFWEHAAAVGGMLFEVGRQTVTNPKGLSYLTAEQAANMVPAIVGMLAGGKSGAVVGGLAGPVGAGVGAVGGAAAGAFAGSAPIEVGSEFIGIVGKELAARGLEPTNENVAALLDDDAFVQRAITDARTKGAVTAGIDAALTVVAGGVASGPRRAALKAATDELGATADAAQIAKRASEIIDQRTIGQTAATGGKAVGVDVAGGGISEAGGQFAAYGEVDLADVGLEMLGELGGTAIEVPAAARAVTSHLRGHGPVADKVRADEVARQRAAAEALQNATTVDAAIAAAQDMAGHTEAMTAGMDVDAAIAATRARMAQAQAPASAGQAVTAPTPPTAESLAASVPVDPALQPNTPPLAPPSALVDSEAASPAEAPTQAIEAAVASAVPPAQEAEATPAQPSNTFSVGREVTPPGSSSGSRATVLTPAGRPVDVSHRLVEVSELITSHTPTGAINPAYPAILQPRDRSRNASELQIHEIATNLHPQLLGASPTTSDGAPVISPDGVVESGNGRTLAIARAYEQGMPSAQTYRQWLQDNGYDVQGMRAPILVRQRETQLSQAELEAYTRESNERTTAAMSDTEQAQADARSLAPILEDYAGGDVSSAANRDFVRKFLRDIVSSSARGELVGPDGMLSQRGQRRIQAALMAAAYDSPEVVADMFESADSDIKAIGGALLDVAGPWAQMREAARSGAIPADLDVTPNLVGAVNIVRRARAEGKGVADLANQVDMLAGETDPATMHILHVFFRGEGLTRARSRGAIASALTDYIGIARSIPSGDNMFGDAPPTSTEILGAAYDRQRQAEATGQQPDILAGAGRTADGAEQAGQEGRRPGPSTVREGAENYVQDRVGQRDGQTIDMFSGQGQTQQGLDLPRDRADQNGARRRAAPRVPTLPATSSTALGIVTHPEEDGTFGVSVEAKQTGAIRIGVDLIQTPDDAAHALASLRKYPQENMVALVTDAQGKPLSVLRHTIGQIAQADVVPHLIAGHVARIPGAARVWLAHNHPSGLATFSDADIRVTDAYADITAGSSVDLAGMFAIAGSRYAFYSPLEGVRYDDRPITPRARTRSVPVSERVFRRAGALEAASIRPDAAPTVLSRLLNGEAGLVFFNNQLQPVAAVPMTTQAMGKLKGTGGLDRVLRGMERSNASAAMVYVPEPNHASIEAARNVGSMIERSGSRILDIVAGRSSLASTGENLTRRDNRFESRDPLLFGADTGVPVPQIQTMVDRITANLPGASDVQVRVVRTRLDVEDAEGTLPSLGAEGVYFPAREIDGQIRPARIYLMAQALPTMDRAEQVLAHELVGHFGMEALLGDRFSAVLEDVVRIGRAPEGVQVGRQRVGDPYYATMEAVQLDYPDYSPANQAREVLARMAETNVRPHFLEVVYAHIRRFLRRLGIEAPLSAAEIKAMVVDSAKQLRRTSATQAVQGSLSAAESMRTAEARSSRIPGEARTDPAPPSEGPSTSRSQVDTPEFKRWFGDSKVVDAEGAPQVVYHGTDQSFDTFEGEAWFTPVPEDASTYSNVMTPQREHAPNVMPVYLSIRKPKVIDTYATRSDIAQAKASGRYDGVIVRGVGGSQISHYVTFRPEQVKSAIGNRGSFDRESPSVLESRAPTNIFGEPVISSWQAPADTKLADLIYVMQDKHVDTRDVVKAIEAKGQAIEDRWNPYLQEELYHGRAAKATADFLNNELRPLLQEMRARNIDMRELETYLHNLHAEERNVQIASINPQMPDGGSGINTADAHSYLAGLDAARRRSLDALAKRVQAISAATRRLLVESGLESPETVQAWESTYSNYVPLQREDMDFGAGMGTGQGYSTRGSSSKRALGSSRNVVDILANVAMQRERAITRAEKNRVAVALYGLATLEPNTDFWMAVNPQAVRDVEQTVNELVQMGLNPLDARGLIDEPKQAYIDPRTGLVSYRVNPAMRNSANVMAVRVNGEDRFVFFNERTERGKRMVSALKNLDADQLGRAMGMLAKVTRWFAAVNTQYNPIFGIVNFTRDTQAAALQLATTELRGKETQVMSHLLPALRGIYSQIRADRRGTTTQSTWAALWDQFQRTGGKTGYRDQFLRSNERALALEKELKKIREGKAKQAGRAIFDWLSDYNDTMENAVRLAAFKTALDNGITPERAASIAKNLTVNFNRKGQIATQASAMYAFFNAAVQGTTRMLETLAGPTGKRIMSGGLLLGVIQALALSAAGYDDNEPPEFVRERNLIIPLGDGKYITIPMPLGYNVLPNTGRVLTEYAMSGWRDPTKRIAQIAGAFMEMFNPLGNAGWSAQTIAPTAADPLVALSENRDWTGKPIAREDFSSLNPTPGYTRAKETASAIGEMVAYGLNAASGGTDFKPGLLSPTPDQIDYLVGQVFGGVGREANKAVDTVKNLRTGEEIPPYKIPLVGRFYGNTQSGAAESSRFYENLRELNMHENEIRGRRETGGDVTGYLRDHPEARLASQANRVESDIRRLRRRRQRMLEAGVHRENIKMVETEITRRQKRFNDRVRQLREGLPRDG